MSAITMCDAALRGLVCGFSGQTIYGTQQVRTEYIKREVFGANSRDYNGIISEMCTNVISLSSLHRSAYRRSSVELSAISDPKGFGAGLEASLITFVFVLGCGVT